MSDNNINNNNNNIQNGFNAVSQSPIGLSVSPVVQQSPISISVTNSAITSNAGTPAFTNFSTVPIAGGSGVPNLASSVLASPVETTTTVKSESNVPSSSLMDIDHEEKPIKDETIVTRENSEQLRLRTLDDIDAKLDLMENTRLEMVPLLLDIIEQVKTGEISIKDVDNVCGRIRLRVNKLREDRRIVESELEKINDQFRCSADENESTKQHIAIKERCISHLIKSIESHNTKVGD